MHHDEITFYHIPDPGIVKKLSLKIVVDHFDVFYSILTSLKKEVNYQNGKQNEERDCENSQAQNYVLVLNFKSIHIVTALLVFLLIAKAKVYIDEIFVIQLVHELFERDGLPHRGEHAVGIGRPFDMESKIGNDLHDVH